MRPPIDETMMTAPPPRSAMAGMVIWQSQWLLRMLLAITLSNALSGMSWLGPKCGFDGGVADEDVDRAVGLVRLVDEARWSSSLLPMLHGITIAWPPFATIASPHHLAGCGPCGSRRRLWPRRQPCASGDGPPDALARSP